MAYNAQEQLSKLKLKLGIIGISKDALLMDLLDDAKDYINRVRRFKPTDLTPIESRYYSLQVKLAVCAYNKMGVEGQTSHNENGVVRQYENGADYPTALTKEIIPLVR